MLAASATATRLLERYNMRTSFHSLLLLTSGLSLPADTNDSLRIFNGKDLIGWRNPFDWGEAQVVDGEIHLTANKKFFLVTEKKYADFELKVDLLLPEGKANSGIMFRCHVEPNRVFGYQAECDGSDRRWSGGLYDEGRRKWVWPSTNGRSLPEFLEYEPESQGPLCEAGDS